MGSVQINIINNLLRLLVRTLHFQCEEMSSILIEDIFLVFRVYNSIAECSSHKRKVNGASPFISIKLEGWLNGRVVDCQSIGKGSIPFSSVERQYI